MDMDREKTRGMIDRRKSCGEVLTNIASDCALSTVKRIMKHRPHAVFWNVA
jgi:hypothetical protein